MFRLVLLSTVLGLFALSLGAQAAAQAPHEPPTSRRSAPSAIPTTERQALIALYTATAGDFWLNNSNWCTTPGGCLTPGVGEFRPVGTECTWYGVTCGAPGEHVTSINLGENNLVGSLPVEIALLSQIRMFYVARNRISGQIPPLTGLAKLELLNVSSNSLTGPIPSLSGLISLEYIYLHRNQLVGSIPCLTTRPPCSSELVNLIIFEADRNRLSGVIPELDALPRLENVALNYNELTGQIPDLTSAPTLRAIRVDHNKLSGAVPSPPRPNQLTPGSSRLCPNQLDLAPSPFDPEWNWAVAGNVATSWYEAPWLGSRCDSLFASNFSVE